MYQILVTQHDFAADIIGVNMWEEEKMPDPAELGNKVFELYGDCCTCLISVNVAEIDFPIYVVLVEGRHDGKQT